MNITLLLGFSDRYLSNQYFEKKDCKRNTLKKPHSKGSTKGHKNSFRNSHKNIRFRLIVSPERITMFGKGNYAVIYLYRTHSFLTAMGCDSFVNQDIRLCLLATRFQVLPTSCFSRIVHHHVYPACDHHHL